MSSRSGSNSNSNNSYNSNSSRYWSNSNSRSNSNRRSNSTWIGGRSHYFNNKQERPWWFNPIFNDDRWNLLPNDKWKVVKLNTPPKQDIAMNNFNKKNAKAVKVSWKENGKNFSQYYTPKTVTGLLGVRNIENWKVRRAMKFLYNTRPDFDVFKHPTTRKMVKRRNLNFVTMKKRTN